MNNTNQKNDEGTRGQSESVKREYAYAIMETTYDLDGRQMEQVGLAVIHNEVLAHYIVDCLTKDLTHSRNKFKRVYSVVPMWGGTW